MLNHYVCAYAISRVYPSSRQLKKQILKLQNYSSIETEKIMALAVCL